MQRAMGNLPQFLATPGDFVLVEKLPSVKFCDSLQSAGFSLPIFADINDALKNPDFIAAPKNWLRPWGWSPAAHRLLEPLKASCHNSFQNSPVASWLPEHRELFSRKTALLLLQYILHNSGLSSLLPKSILPQICLTTSEVENLSERYPLMVKQPWSSSGRGLQKISQLPPGKMVLQKVGGMLKTQGYVMAEPLLDKVADLGLLYEITEAGIVFTGISRFFTDNKGQYQGNHLKKRQSTEDGILSDFIESTIQTLPPWHIKGLQAMNVGNFYRGPLGIDLLIYRDDRHALKLHPVVEINWRATMGHISHSLEGRIAEGSVGKFLTYINLHSEFSQFCIERSRREMLKMEGGKLVSGFLPLTDYQEKTGFGAYLEISQK